MTFTAASAASLVAIAVVAASPAFAQPSAAGSERSIVVVGSGEASRPADYAMVAFSVRGEGPRPEDALRLLAEGQAKINSAVGTLAGVQVLERRTDFLAVNEMRSPACGRNQPYSPQPPMNAGDCAVLGAVATLNVRLKVVPAARAGDMVSYVTQLGGKAATMQGSGVNDRDALEREAMRKAVADAKAQALLIAEAAGGKLGPVLRLQDSVVPQGAPVLAAPPAPAPPPPPPGAPEALRTAIAVGPPPTEVTARVTVTYALEP